MELAKIGLAVESKGLKEGIRNLRQLEGEGARTERGMSKLKGTVAAVSAAFAALGAQAFARDIIREADQLNRNLLRTQQLIDTTGRNAERSAQSTREQARQIALATLQSTEGVMQAQQTLLTFRNITGETFDQAIAGAVDLSSAMGQDLNSSVLQLGKALEDPVKGLTALSRSGTVFTDAQREMVKEMVETNRTAEAQQFILSELAAQYGGVAEAEAKGLAGAQDTLGQRIQESKLELADQLNLIENGVTAYNVMSDAALSLTDNMDKVIQVTQALTVLIGSRLTAALATATAAKIAASYQAIAYQAALARMAGASVAATTAVGALRGALALLGGPIGLLIGAGGLLYTFREELGLVKNAAEPTTQRIDDLTDSINKNSVAAVEAGIVQLSAEYFTLGQRAASASAEIEKLTKAQEDDTRGARQSLQNQMKISDLQGELAQLTAEQEAAGEAASQLRGTLSGLGETVVDETDSLGGLSDATATNTTAVDDAARATDKYANSLQPLLDRLYPVEAASRQYRSEQEALTVALARGEIGVVRYLDALNRLEEAQRSEQTPSEAYSGVGFGSQISSGEQGPGMGEQDPFAQWLEQANQAFTSFDQLQADTAQSFQTSFGQAFEQVLMGTKSADEAFKEMGRTILSTVVTAIGEMIAQWLVAQAVQIAMGQTGAAAALTTAAATGPAMAAAYAPAAAMASLASFGTNSVPAIAGITATTAAASTAATLGNFAGMFDEGGRIGGGQWGIAGEYGPEIIKGPAQVTSRKDTAAMMGGGDVTVNVNNAPPGTQVKERSVNGNQVIDVLVADLSQNGRASQAMQSTFGMNRRGR